MESTAEGEAQRYFDHALTLKNTILFLRYNKELTQDQGPDIPNIGKLDSCILVIIALMRNHMSDPVVAHLHMSIDVLNGQLPSRPARVLCVVLQLSVWFWLQVLAALPAARAVCAHCCL